MRDIVVRHRTVGRGVGMCSSFVVLHPLIVVCIGVLQNDVEGVEEAGEEAEAAKGDVDERVGAADAALDPDCDTVSFSSPVWIACRQFGTCDSLRWVPGAAAARYGGGELTSNRREEH